MSYRARDDVAIPNAGVIVRDKLWFDDGFTMVPNAWIRDKRLPRDARALAIELASHDPGFEMSVDWLVREGTEGRDAVRVAIGHLERAGYLKRYRSRGERGKFGRVQWHLRDPWKPRNMHGQVPLDLEELIPMTLKKSWSAPAPGLPAPVPPAPVPPAPVNPTTIEDKLKEDLLALNGVNPSTGARDEVEHVATCANGHPIIGTSGGERPFCAYGCAEAVSA